MAIIQSTDAVYIFDSHARNCFGMPDPNGTAVVMKCVDVSNLEQYIYRLALTLNCETFEIVPVEFYADKNDNHYCNTQSRMSSSKRKRQNETEAQKSNRLQKAREYKKKRMLLETETEKQNRLEKDNNGHKRKIFVESELQRHERLRKNNDYHKMKIVLQTELQKKSRLEKSKNYQRQKNVNRTETCKKGSQESISQQDYLNQFDALQNGNLHDQSWAKANMCKFHSMNKYVISQCTVCFEA